MPSRFLGHWLISAILVSVFAAGVSTVTDPYGLFRFFDKPGINQQKEGVRNKIRFVKALELPLRQPHTLIMGSSRVHDGVNPAHPLLGAFGDVYNYGVDMARIWEMHALLRHAILNSRVDRVIIGLDFFMFNSLQRNNFDFDAKLVGRKINAVDYISGAIFSRSALVDSFHTLNASIKVPERREFLGNGYRPQAFFGMKDYPAAHYYTSWVFLTPRPQSTRYYAEMSVRDDAYSELDQLIQLCVANKIALHLYISPAHANLDGEGLVALGKYDELDLWKRKVTEVAEKHKIRLWDFSGYNSVTTEPVMTPMKYYWDPSHFTEVVSDWMLQRIFGHGESVPADFGVLLTSQNIDAHLKNIRADRARYLERNQEALRELHAEYKAIIAGAPLDLKRLNGMY